MKYKCKINFGLDCYNESQSERNVATYLVKNTLRLQIKTTRESAEGSTVYNLKKFAATVTLGALLIGGTSPTYAASLTEKHKKVQEQR